jgi:hypothetical protein
MYVLTIYPLTFTHPGMYVGFSAAFLASAVFLAASTWRFLLLFLSGCCRFFLSFSWLFYLSFVVSCFCLGYCYRICTSLIWIRASPLSSSVIKYILLSAVSNQYWPDLIRFCTSLIWTLRKKFKFIQIVMCRTIIALTYPGVHVGFLLLSWWLLA